MDYRESHTRVSNDEEVRQEVGGQVVGDPEQSYQRLLTRHLSSVDRHVEEDIRTSTEQVVVAGSTSRVRSDPGFEHSAGFTKVLLRPERSVRPYVSEEVRRAL